MKLICLLLLIHEKLLLHVVLCFGMVGYAWIEIDWFGLVEKPNISMDNNISSVFVNVLYGLFVVKIS